ncbi:MAG: lysylphosphatidylglycerol synthase domain-containing protein [bacterium]|nr:lysylphosphatidylglycerol synthase domain-containing protein [bacterium]
MAALKYLKIVLQWIFIIATIGFLFYTLYINWEELKGYDFTISWGYFILSYLFLFVHFVLIALAWGLLLRALQKPGVPLLQALRIRTISDFARFIPGKFWFVMFRIRLCKKYNLSPAMIAVSALMEEFLNIFSTILLFIFVFIIVSHETLTSYALYVSLSLPLFFFLMHPLVFQWFIKLAAKLFKKEYVKSKIQYTYLLSLLSVFFLAWIILGFGFYLMSYAVYPMGIELFLPLTGVFAIAWAAGFLVIVLPGGLGLREAVLGYLLAFFFPVPIAILLSLLSRLWLISGEVLTAFVFRFIK